MSELNLPLPIRVKLVGEDSNAFSLLGVVTRAMKRTGYEEHVEEFRKEAMGGDYDHLLQTCMKWVEIE